MVCLWIWGKFRDPDPPTLDKGILKAGGNFEIIDKRDVLGIISIHFADLLISGVSDFTDYISWVMKDKFEAGRYGGTNQLI